ncbi:hypothetical protein ACFFOS_25425 [Nocardioides kongjuensis]|uniref:Uncharacterized protein n=1 Tax=Nocardioides kongjuensis TaxID=349522 RepID=A0A852RK13_9ACTN|nr:hypothetical protein [Nocardioides kongjuensis]NYD33831.1 hypothetical protein [Nocardioides kongjuensis]
MNPVPRAVAALACAAGLLLTTPALASAADLVHTDPAHDVRVGDIDSERTHPAADERRVDVRRVEVSHGLDALTIRLRTRGPLPTKRLFLAAQLKAPSGRFEVTYMKFLGESGVSLTRKFDEVPCEGLTATLERKAVTFVVPTACFGTPAWVRVGAGAAQMRKQKIVMDDGFSRGAIDNDLHLSKRIARG